MNYCLLRFPQATKEPAPKVLKSTLNSSVVTSY